MEKKKKFQMPHTYIIIFGVILFAAILTMFIPLGKYETKEITYTMNGEEKTRTVLDPDSFEYVLDENGNKVTKVAPLFGTEDFGGQGILNYVFEGMTTGTKKWYRSRYHRIHPGCRRILRYRTQNRCRRERNHACHQHDKRQGRFSWYRSSPSCFSLGGAVFGMGEEAIPFVMILVPMFIAMGYDAVVGIMCSYVATQVGFGTSWQNPFGLAVAQGIAGIPVMSGAWFRYSVMDHLYCADLRIHHALCRKGEKRTRRCLLHTSLIRSTVRTSRRMAKRSFLFTLGHKLVLLTVVACMVWTIWGVVAQATTFRRSLPSSSLWVLFPVSSVSFST